MPGHIDNMIELLGPRQVIGQAINLLMTRDHMNRDAAFAQLVQRSAASHRNVRETAAEILVEQRTGE